MRVRSKNGQRIGTGRSVTFAFSLLTHLLPPTMATLTKVKPEREVILSLASSVPTPFPKEILAVNSSSADVEQHPQQQELEVGPSNISEATERQENGSLVRIYIKMSTRLLKIL